MNAAEAARAIFQRWIECWPTLAPGVPYALEGNTAREGDGLFARVAIVSQDVEQATLGPAPRRRWDHSGLIEVRLTGPINQGREPLDELAEKVRTIYQGKRFGFRARSRGVVTHAMDVTEVRSHRDAGARRLVLCSVEFEHTDRA